MIDVQLKSTVRGKVPAALLRRAAEIALGRRAANVSIAIVGDARMRRLNRDTLGHDYTTDVLSFDHGDSPEGLQIELIVCLPFARRSAREHKITPEQELARYVVHGCLHCVGFDDSTEALRKNMWAEQEHVMRKLFGRRYRA